MNGKITNSYVKLPEGKSSDSWCGLPEFPQISSAIWQKRTKFRNQSLLNVKPPAIQFDQHEVIGICWAHRVRSLGTILVLVSNGNGKPPIGRWYTSCEFPAFFCYWQHQKIYGICSKSTWNIYEHIFILRMFCCQIRLITISRHSVCTHQTPPKFQQWSRWSATTMPRRSRFFLRPLRGRTETVRSTMTTMRMRTPSMQAVGWNCCKDP